MSSGILNQNINYIFNRHFVTVVAARSYGVKNVCNCQNSSAIRNFFTFQMSVIACSIVFFMVRAGNFSDNPEIARHTDIIKNIVRDFHMFLNMAVFFRREFSFFLQNAVANTDFSDIVKNCGFFNKFFCFFVKF